MAAPEGRHSPHQGFRSPHIARLLSAAANVEDCEDEMSCPMPQDSAESCSADSGVVYVLFLEEILKPTSIQTCTTWLADEAIRRFDTSPLIPPQLVHTELLIPPDRKADDHKVLFATYLGGNGADWQNVDEKDSGVDFYLIQNGYRWRALPVTIRSGTGGVRRIADANRGAKYSLAMYVTSAPFARAFSGLWSDVSGAKGHCGVITARVLKAAGRMLSRPSALYSPTSLYNEMNAGCTQDSTTTDYEKLESSDIDNYTSTIATLLHGPLSAETVRELGDDKCREAVRLLTENVYAAGRSMDAAAIRQSQMQLANVLLKWILLRT